MQTVLAGESAPQVFDVIVIGAGCAGLAAAIYATADGARVLLVESQSVVGGTSAHAAATTWVPGTSHAGTVGADDTFSKADQYLAATDGSQSFATQRTAFLTNGAEAIAKIERVSELKFRARPLHPDYISERAGATAKGRALEPLPFDGRLLRGETFKMIRPPLPELTVLGGMMVDKEDVFHLLNIRKSLPSFWHSTRIVLRHLRDRLTHNRGTRLVMGNAMIGRMMHSLEKTDVTLLLETDLAELIREGERVVGVILRDANGLRRVEAKAGVILAGGGFNRSAHLRSTLLAEAPPHWSLVGPGAVGRTIELAQAVGGALGKGGGAGFWAPASHRRRKDGSLAVFPHFLHDRAKPGMIAVDGAGQRFVSESTSYHRFALAMRARNHTAPCLPAYLITDAQGMRRYGLGMVRPRGLGLRAALADGYIIKADSIAQLALRLKLDPATLEDTITRFNAMARSGEDQDFARGSTLFERTHGDGSRNLPNPNLAPLEAAPFYAVALWPGDIGASAGLATDAQARVLDKKGQPIFGLYACGNDMESLMGAEYPGPGITLGPAIVFAYLAVADALRAKA